MATTVTSVDVSPTENGPAAQGQSRILADVQQQLAKVVEMTEEAANKTLDTVDELMPHVREMMSDSEKLEEAWGRLNTPELMESIPPPVNAALQAFMKRVRHRGTRLKDGLHELTAAQGYQDLTGQIVKRVVSTLELAETQLGAIDDQLLAQGISFTSGEEATGFHTEAGKEGVVEDQDSVDDLLDDLGI